MYSYSQVSTGRVSLGREAHKLTGTTTDCVSKVKFSPQGCPMQLLGVASWDCVCSVWEVGMNGPQIASRPAWSTTHDAPILDLTFSPDGKAFFGGCSKTAIMWDLRTNQKTPFGSHDLPISCISHVSIPQVMNDVLITGSWDGRLRWWDLRQPNCIKEVTLGEPIFDLDAQKTTGMMSVATGRKIHLFNKQNMEKVQELLPPKFVHFNFRCVASSPKADGVAAGTSEGRVVFLSLDKAADRTFKSHIVQQPQYYAMHQANFCVYHPTLPLIITGGGDGCIAGVDREKNSVSIKEQCTERIENEYVPISAGDLNADGTLVAYAQSYDWALGKAGYRGQPTSVNIRSLNLGR